MSRERTPGRLSLRVVLPLGLFALFTAAGTLLYLYNRELLSAGVEREADRQIVQDLTLIQDIVNEQLRLGTIPRAQQTLANYGALADLRCALIVNNRGTVLASARRDHIGRPFRSLLPEQIADAPLFTPATLWEIASTQVGERQIFSDAEMVAGVYPVLMGIKPGELRPTRTGFVIFVRSLAGIKRERIAWEQSRDWMFGSILASLSIGLGLSLHFLVTKRLSRIATTAGRVKRGDLEARTGIRGHDEIATLAEAFDSMVAERSRQEQTILQLNEDLEARVRRRTVALEKANEELVRAEKLSTLGQLAGGVAHELRTPLGVLSNAIYFLREVFSRRESDPEIIDAIEESSRAVNNSRHIIDEMLDYGKGAQPARSIEFPVGQAVRSALGDVEIPEGIDVAVEGDRNTMALGAPDQVGRIISNLVRNAIEAVKEHGNLHIRIQPRDHHVEIEVQDDGPGIAAGDLANVFEPLFSKKTTGIGLGLALSRRYAELNGGSLVAESPPDGGALFRLTLPRAAHQPAGEPDWQSDAEPGEQNPLGTRQSRRSILP